MLHPDILRQYGYRRAQLCNTPVDACCDTAAFYGFRIDSLAQFLRAVGVDVDHLRNL
jgi:hypothetical protein